MPAHNSARTIGSCLESLRAQSRPVGEVVVVDDASSDQTATIAGGYGCTVLRLPTNLGPAAARNRGIAATRGAILFFLDADVALAPDAVANAVTMLLARPEYAGVSGIYATRPLFDDGLVERCQVLHAHYWRRRNQGTVASGYFSLGAFRRSALDRVGRFDEDMYHGEDTEYGFRIAAQYPMLLSAAVCGYHDDDDAVAPIVRKYFHRTSSVVPTLLRQRRRPRHPDRGPARRSGLRQETAFRAGHLGSAALTLATVPLVALSPVLAAAPVAFLCLFCLAEPRMLQFVRREAGLRMLVPYFALHYLACLAVVAGTAVGALRLVAWARWPKARVATTGRNGETV